MRKGFKRTISILLVLLVVALIYFKIQSKEKEKEKGAMPAGKGGAMTVGGFILTPSRLDNVVRTAGTIMAFDEVELKAETSGRISKIYFTEGSHVNKGALLVKINDDDLQAALRKIESKERLAEQQRSRQDQLLKIKASSQEEYDIVESQLNELKADKDVVIASINKTEIRAPFSGNIGLRFISEGSYVSPATKIASMQNVNPVKIDFSVPEKYAGMIVKGDIVKVVTDEASVFEGRVYAIEPKIDVSTRTLQVRAICDNKSGKIMPGAFAKIELQLKETPDALMIPTQALIPVLKGQTVFVAKNGLAQSVPVKTGERTPSHVQVTDGLAAGDTIITTGIMSLKPNVPVKVIIKS